MKYFVEEKHTNKELVWVLKNRIVFNILVLAWFFVSYLIVMLVVLSFKGNLNLGALTFIGIILFFVLFLGLAQILNKFFDVIKARWKARRLGKKVSWEFTGNNMSGNTMTIRIEK